MIFPRSDIFIVYSNVHKESMQLVLNRIAKEKSVYNVKAVCLNNDTLTWDGAKNLWKVLHDTINNADGAIILYTPDETMKDGQMMPRPNIIFEMGMIFELLPPEKIMVLKYSDAEFFSNIHGINFKNADDAGMGSIVKEFLKKCFSKLEINPLLNKDYIPKYTRDMEKRYHNCNLRDEFIHQLCAFDEKDKITNDERDKIKNDDKNKDTVINNKIVFIAERMLFTGIMRSMHTIIMEQIADLMNGCSDHQLIYKNSLLVLKNTMDYLRFRQEERHASAHSKSIENYTGLYHAWNKLIDWFSVSSDAINPLIPLLCYDYAGLTLHKLILDKMDRVNYQQDTFNKIQLVIGYYEKALSYVSKVDDAGVNLWKGYVYFDLARIYACKYHWFKKYDRENSQMEETKKMCMQCFDEVISIRRGWYLTPPKMPNQMVIQLQCEYFYASLDYLEVLIELGEENDLISRENCLSQYNQLISNNNDNLHDMINVITNKFNRSKVVIQSNLSGK